VLWDSPVDGCACCAQTGIATADASVNITNWRGKESTAFGKLFIESTPQFMRLAKPPARRALCALTLEKSNAAAKGGLLPEELLSI
jgi:hypothetical protein